MNDPKTWLGRAADADDDALIRCADALTGLLAFVVQHDESEREVERAHKLHDEADAALGRVLMLAENLDANPRATLKPVAFADLAKRIRNAVDGAA